MDDNNRRLFEWLRSLRLSSVQTGVASDSNCVETCVCYKSDHCLLCLGVRLGCVVLGCPVNNQI